MRKNYFIIAAIAASVCSCGAPKNMVDNHNQSQTMANQRTLRITEPCEELAWQRDFAAVGTATSFNEKVARSEAVRDARYELGRMMQAAVEGAAEDYLRNISKNKKSKAESISEEINNQFFAECVKNSKVIKTTTYDLPTGEVQVYVCVEVVAGFDVLEKTADVVKNVLDKDDEIEVEFDKFLFKENMKDKMKEFKENKTK